MNILVVDPNGSPATWLGAGMLYPTKTYVTVDPRSGEHVIVAVLDPNQPMETMPFAVQQEFQR